MRSHHQVVIVGGGPVGAGLAVNLGLRGITCALVEPRLDLGRVPKGQNLTQRTLEHFSTWKLDGELRKARLMPTGFPIGELTAYGHLMSDYWHAPAGRELVRDFYDQDNERLPQYRMEEVLRRKLKDLPSVKAFFGWSASAVAQDDDGVQVTISTAGGNEISVLTGDYVVGCDGSQSMVRERAGIARSKDDYEQLMLLAVFRSSALNERLSRFPERSTYRVLHPDLNGYWQFFGRIDVPDGWFFHAPVPADSTIDVIDATALISRAAGFDCPCAFEHVGFWRMRVAIAERYRAGRIFIAGDAAHSHPPYGGFGLNNGLEDIVNLGWKLAACLQGWGGETLLRSYGDERRPVFRETADHFITARIRRDADFLDRYRPERDRAEFEAAWHGRATDVGSRFQQYEPHYEGSPVIFGPPGGVSSARGTHAVKARPGHHLAPVPLSSGGSTFKQLGRDFTLLAFDAPDRAVAAFERAARALGIPLATIRDDRDDGRQAYEARLILVRPDQYVVWAGDELTDDAEVILRRGVGGA